MTTDEFAFCFQMECNLFAFEFQTKTYSPQKISLSLVLVWFLGGSSTWVVEFRVVVASVIPAP